MKNIAIFASGDGSNAENIYKFFSNGSRVRVPVVIYDRKDAGVARRMEKYDGVKTVHIPKSVWETDPDAVLDILREERIDLVVLAGFLRVIPEKITAAYSGRMLNIHPSLLPAYGGKGMYGMKVHEAVIAAGEKKSGVTIHYVSDVLDGGEILMQESVDVLPDDTPESLQQKVHALEYDLYPRAIISALAKTDAAPANDAPPAISGVTPPAPPTPPATPAEEWAETLGVSFDPEKLPEGTPGAPLPPEQVQDVECDDPAIAKSPRGRVPENGEKMPDNYLVWSVIMTVLCCLPAGIVAIIFSSQVSSKFYAGDIEGANKASERAQIWIIVSFVLGIISNTLYLPVMLLFN